MAHAAKVSALLDGLVQSLSGGHASPRTNDRNNHTLKTLRSGSYARVNQFDVQSRYEGLEEKFRVLNNDPLADALRSRLDELTAVTYEYKPDLLALFLLLSDRPLEKAVVADAEPADAALIEPALTWEDILADDPFEEEGIWDNVDTRSDSTDTDFQYSDEDHDDQAPLTEASSIAEDDYATSARTYILPAHHDGLKASRDAAHQLPRTDSRSTVTAETVKLSELQVICEAIHMLHGLPTRLFTSEDNGQVHFAYCIEIKSIASATSTTILSGLAEIGSQLRGLKQWSCQPRKSRLLQRFQAAFLLRLRMFEKDMSEIEQSLASPCKDVIVSVHKFFSQVRHYSRNVLLIKALLGSMRQEDAHWVLLDKIYEECCRLHSAGDELAFTFFEQLFSECVPVYLHHVRLWMTRGSLEDNDGLLFISTSSDRVALGSLWHDKLHLRRAADGSVLAPGFIRPHAEAIFAAGKSVMFLRSLGEDSTDILEGESSTPNMALFPEETSLSSFESFSDIFEVELKRSITSMSSTGVHTLRDTLVSKHGLLDIIIDFHAFYLSKDGTALQSFADIVYEKMDRRPQYWADRFVLTGDFYSAFGTSLGRDVERVSVRISKSAAKDHNTILERIESLRLDYVIPWPIQNVTRETSPAMCQQAFSLLLKTYRAKYIIRGLKLERGQSLRGDKSKLTLAINLRQRLNWFVDTIQMHFCETASQAVSKLSAGFAAADDIDEMASLYSRFNDQLANGLLLSPNLAPIRSAIEALLLACEALGIIWHHTPSNLTRNQRSENSVPSTDTSSREDDTDNEDTSSLAPKDKHDTPRRAPRSISALRTEYERQLPFIIAGLRAVARSGTEPSWSVLAERLAWGQKATTRPP